ncbi:energy transducer TonB [Paraburkholderia lycopersici]|uniref:Protein TonB n=1 Tax=Paraburkholderia lycopersici TaxID=416944 RepID=A0A1G7D5P9_9BURK|nr:energy transducer TonB [Paraburkholderia lycopersici]SDE46330.1 protein TonB [Paraburkholderia lycopersici]
MSNDGRRLNSVWLDEPKTRIAVVAVVAFGSWCGALFLVGGLLATPEIEPPPAQLDAQLLEIEPPPPPLRASAPAQAAPTHPTPPANVARDAPPPVQHARPVHEERAPQHAAPVPAAATPAAPAPVAVPSTAPSPAPSAPLKSATPPGSTVSHSPGATDPAANGSGHTPARAITQPLPEIPDDLREAAYHAIALARFTIHPDGSVDVELLQPTQQPRLNQLLLASLHNWRFFPATENGKPVESHQDVRVHLVVQ